MAGSDFLPSRQAGHILVVDDEEHNRMLLVDVLEARGHQTVEATDGEQALRLVEQDPPDLILLDVMMPRMNGFEVCRRLKASPRTASIPILLVTSLGDRKDRLAGIEAGANDFLTKPIDTHDVVLRVRNALYAKRIHDQLQAQHRRLQELEALRDSLTSMIVHDLRTPLNAIIGYSEMLQENAHEAGLDELSLDLHKISAAGKDLLALINDLLDVSKMEDGSMQLEWEAVSAGPLIETALGQVATLARKKNLTLVTELAPDLPPFRADEEKLRRTIVNLLGNAIKFTPEEGTITVGACRDMVQEAVIFSVRDTGEGIPAEAFGRIFEKFGQVETRKAGRKMSTGLGLTFCKMVAEAHGGRIWVESELGKGSVFLFSIPEQGATLDFRADRAHPRRGG